jgi:hypothetical protein
MMADLRKRRKIQQPLVVIEWVKQFASCSICWCRKSGVVRTGKAMCKSSVGAFSLVTPRPTIDKKKARQLVQHSNSCTQITRRQWQPML